MPPQSQATHFCIVLSDLYGEASFPSKGRCHFSLIARFLMECDPGSVSRTHPSGLSWLDDK